MCKQHAYSVNGRMMLHSDEVRGHRQPLSGSGKNSLVVGAAAAATAATATRFVIVIIINVRSRQCERHFITQCRSVSRAALNVLRTTLMHGNCSTRTVVPRVAAILAV